MYENNSKELVEGNDTVWFLQHNDVYIFGR